MRFISYIVSCFWLFVPALALSNGLKRRVSIVTGANGYVGREVVNVLLEEQPEDCQDEILCLVRSHRVESENSYWKDFPKDSSSIKVLPYDMLDGGKTFGDALSLALNDEDDLDVCVYHLASVFGPSEDSVQTAKDNVQGTKDLVETLGKLSPKCRLVVTSSMAAVRGSGQTPKNGKHYTYEDWNTVSQLDENNWGSCYQWSKAESERVAWELCKDLEIPLTTICPSFVFGPPTSENDLSSSFSITLVGQWVRGESTVQSRLFVDVRDVAKAHVEAAKRPEAIGERIIVSSEARMPSQEMAEVLKEVCDSTGLGDPSKITFDGEFQGGAIPIGSQEVEAMDRLESLLGLKLTPLQDTIR
eukprot:CAMPEP_0116146826 /NCGR_PEP_ID=MMETSP0329-20121206/17386_1 /TAXON_ID=697910 /ORGANISM="Pseudo-nitzschia arenysensis, Strain B593" /LENGTH=358 /DNA_ID=CAMNT_0003642629 /DNA_START=1 /DNA_END=1074 /DNA_ORIENTATION=-